MSTTTEHRVHNDVIIDLTTTPTPYGHSTSATLWHWDGDRWNIEGTTRPMLYEGYTRGEILAQEVERMKTEKVYR